MSNDCDFLVIGAGIAGASAAYFLAKKGRVTVLEREDAPGYHTTGRSAALFIASTGPPTVCALARAAQPFFETPPAGFAEHPLLTPRGALTFARPGEEGALAALFTDISSAAPTARMIDAAEAIVLCEALERKAIAAAIWEPDVFDIDVGAMLAGYLSGLKARGGTLVTGAEVTRLARADGRWTAETTAGSFTAPVVVNAAGAWADVIARLAGVTPVGLVPKRRTAFTFDPPAGMDCDAFPVVGDVTDSFYFKPEAGRVLVSPADATPSPPCDAQPEELDVAIAADRMEQVTTFEVRRVTHKWAGLRSFVADGLPVAGFAPDVGGFFWLAGQGGYGILTSPAMGRLTAALATGGPMPADILAHGVTADDLAPGRAGLTSV